MKLKLELEQMKQEQPIDKKISEAVKIYENKLDIWSKSFIETEGAEALTKGSVENLSKILKEFLHTLAYSESEVLLVSLGGYKGPDSHTPTPLDQQIPSYMVNFSKQYKSEIMLLDMGFNLNFEHQSETFAQHFMQDKSVEDQPFLSGNEISFTECVNASKETYSHHFRSTTKDTVLSLSTFGIYFPPSDAEMPMDIWVELFEKKLESGCKIFIAYHMNAYDLFFAPVIADLYNTLQSKYPSLIKLYIQEACTPVCLFEGQYQEKNVDDLYVEYNKSHKKSLDDHQNEAQILYSLYCEKYNDFVTILTINDLSDVFCDERNEEKSSLNK